MCVSLSDLETPCIVLNRRRLDANLERLARVAETCDVVLRPHLKTAKSVELAQRALAKFGKKATVSTLKEAEIFGRAGITDLLYAVAITPQKFRRVAALRREGVDLKVVVENVVVAQELATYSKKIGEKIPALIELDLDGHRSGVRFDDTELLVVIGRALEEGAHLSGVMAHAGESYFLSDPVELRAAAAHEAAAACLAADILKQNGLHCGSISVGSTPTALSSTGPAGITELRAGVFMFFDLTQAGVGVCTQDDIAMSVLTTVISSNPTTGRLVTDSGWMALSQDRGTSGQAVDFFYGQVCSEDGTVLPDILVLDVQQEHGIIGVRPGSGASMPTLPIGARLRILPNHACATATQHDAYHVIDQANNVVATWPRFSGW